MSRWNILNIVYYSHNGKKRLLNFDRESVNIVTGASNTGKTAIIKTIDYCLGSSKCTIPTFIKDRVSHVSVKWSDGTTELLVSRIVPTWSNPSTLQMFVEYGSVVRIHDSPYELKGKTQRDQARLVIERLFGIGNVFQEKQGKTDVPSRISIRQATPYLFLTKGVIDSETTLMHGLDDPKAAAHIIGAIPFFLGAVGEEEMNAERRLKQLSKAVEYEEKKWAEFERSKDGAVDKCHSIIREAMQCGIIPTTTLNNDVEELLPILHDIANWQPRRMVFPDDEQMQGLIRQKAEAFELLQQLKRKRKSAEQMNETVGEFDNVIDRQLSKIQAVVFFDSAATVKTCPVCSSHMLQETKTSKAIENAFLELSRERSVVRSHRPLLGAFVENINKAIFDQQTAVEKVDQQIRSLVEESDEAKKMQDSNQRAIRVSGRVSFFLDAFQKPEDYDTEKLKSYREEIADLEDRFDKNHKEEKLRIAESLISGYASEIFDDLPRGEPCNTGKILFLSRKPSIVVYDHRLNREHQFEDIGSDENYLSLHIAFIFGMQRFLEEAKRPVPGVVILDQVSRPYFPQEADFDEVELSSDEDSAALRRYFKFLFKEVSKRSGLQVIVLEHAYFGDDEQYRNAVKYRWPKKGHERLIPSEWPTK